jgi:hypothetical protein
VTNFEQTIVLKHHEKVLSRINKLKSINGYQTTEVDQFDYKFVESARNRQRITKDQIVKLQNSLMLSRLINIENRTKNYKMSDYIEDDYKIPSKPLVSLRSNGVLAKKFRNSMAQSATYRYKNIPEEPVAFSVPNFK